MKYLMKHYLYLLIPTLLVIGMNVSSEAASKPEKRREIFVPEIELSALLDGCADRVLLPRNEFDELVAKADAIAKADAEKMRIAGLSSPAPVSFAMLASKYEIQVEGELVSISGVVELETFANEPVLIPLPHTGVVLRGVTLDANPAKIGRKTDNDPLLVIVEKNGKHRLQLEYVTTLQIDSTRQEFAFKVPTAPQSQWSLEIPGDVELESGASIIKRTVDGHGVTGKTRFEFIAQSGNVHLVMTLNSHKSRSVRAVLAKSVQFNEITENYRRIHATVSLDVLHRPIDSFSFAVPDGFDVTDVDTTMLNNWKMQDGKLELRFREPVSGNVGIRLSAIRNEAISNNETDFTVFVPLDVDSNVAVFGLLLDTRLNVGNISADGLIRIESTALRSAIPKSVFDAAPGAPTIRLVSAWYAPKEAAKISAFFTQPRAEIDVTTNLVLDLSEQTQSLQGVFVVTPTREKLFSVTVSAAKNWQLTKATDVSDTALEFEKADGPENPYKIKLPFGVKPGEVYRILFEAKCDTSDWFGNWREKELSFPNFSLVDATRDSGTIAIHAEDDWTIVPTNSSHLIPLDDAAKAKYLGGVMTHAAFRYIDRPYGLDITIRKITPTIKAKSYSFYSLEPALLKAHYELDYRVDEAATDTVSFSLPASTGKSPSIKLRDTMSGIVAIKEYSSDPTQHDGIDMNLWTVKLTKPVSGSIWVCVDMEKKIPLSDSNAVDTVSLPKIKVENVSWQSDFFSVEGHEELNISIPETEKCANRAMANDKF